MSPKTAGGKGASQIRLYSDVEPKEKQLIIHHLIFKRMNKVIVMFALMLGMTMSAFAQETDKVNRKTECQTGNSVKLTKEAYPRMDTEGDLYHGLTRKLTFDRLIPPYGLEVTYDKTTHIIFPSAVRYVDLGSPHLIAGKADGRRMLSVSRPQSGISGRKPISRSSPKAGVSTPST